MVGGQGAFAADAPLVAAKLDDGGRQVAGSFAGIKDERDAIAKLAENFVATFACGGAGEVGTGSGERNTKFGNQIGNDFTFGPAKSDATSVASDLQGKAVGSVHDDGERTGPAGVSETKEIVGEILGQNRSVNEGIDQDWKGAVFGPAFDAEDFLDGGKIDRISGEGVERVRGDSNNGTTV